MERVEFNDNIPKLPKSVILQVIKESDRVTVAFNSADYEFADYASAVTCALVQLAVGIRLNEKCNIDDFFDEVVECAREQSDVIYTQLVPNPPLNEQPLN